MQIRFTLNLIFTNKKKRVLDKKQNTEYLALGLLQSGLIGFLGIQRIFSFKDIVPPSQNHTILPWMKRYKGKFSMSPLQWTQQCSFWPESFSKEANTLLRDFSTTTLKPLLSRDKIAMQLAHNLLQITLNLTKSPLFHLLCVVIIRFYECEVYINILLQYLVSILLFYFGGDV